MRTIIIAAALATLATTAYAQSSASPAPSPPPPTSGTIPAPNTPPVDCRGQAQAKGLRGQDARDAVAICVAERRLACVKEAVERKIVNPQRRDFVRACAGRPQAEGNGE